jgi:hypothetical protein
MSGCHQAAGNPPTPAPCEPEVPASAQHPLAVKVSALAGDYTLIQVRTQPVAGVVTSGRLHLAPLDSTARASAVGGAVRDLDGWLEPAPGDTVWRRKTEAALAGQHLSLGNKGDLDGYREHLTITAVTPDGLRGWWKADMGLGLKPDPATGRILPEPAGYFCGLRIVP